MVTIDAMGCQKEIAQLIIDKEADYLFVVKGNQAGLLEEIEDSFRLQSSHTQTFEEAWAYAHGRHEKRSCQILPQIHMLNPEKALPWEKLQTLVKVVAQRQPKGKKLSIETRYYISTEEGLSPRYYNNLARGHWGIENQLHWHLDMTFKEDQSTVSCRFGPQNLSALRKIALQRISYLND